MEVGQTSVGAGIGGGGEMPITNLNNSYSGHIIWFVPDVMSSSAQITYQQVWQTIKLQHPLLNVYTTPGLTVDLSLTVVKIEFFGASSGMISLAPRIQYAPSYIHEPTTVPPGVQKAAWLGQQQVDVGTIGRRPYLAHYFGDSIASTRMVNQVVGTDIEARAHDQLVEYQMQQFAAVPQPIDAGYLRVSFIIRRQAGVDLTTAIIEPPAPALQEGEIDLAQRKRTHEVDKMRKIDKIKRLTLPTLDSA